MSRIPGMAHESGEEGSRQPSQVHMFHEKNRVTFLEPVATIDVDKDVSNATSGFIVSDETPGIRMIALSGWRSLATRGAPMLDNEKYTQLVRDVANILDFNLPADRLDNGRRKAQPGHRGRFMACHIEKKLGVWWIRKLLKMILKTRDISRLSELQGMEILEQMKRATVVLNHEPCSNCLGFLEELSKATAITIVAESRPYLQEGVRERTAMLPPLEAAPAPPPPPPRAPALSKDLAVAKTQKPGGYTSPPKPWEKWDYPGSKPCAKPKPRKITAEDFLMLQRPTSPAAIASGDDSSSTTSSPPSPTPAHRRATRLLEVRLPLLPKTSRMEFWPLPASQTASNATSGRLPPASRHGTNTSTNDDDDDDNSSPVLPTRPPAPSVSPDTAPLAPAITKPPNPPSVAVSTWPLDLSRFRYTARPNRQDSNRLSTSASPASSRRRGSTSFRSTRPPAALRGPNKGASKAASRVAKLRRKSVFAKAFERHRGRSLLG